MFKHKVGLSPHRYLMQVRIEKAMELLGSRCYTNAEIASVCGFASIPHFSATFKEITGIPPECYKNRLG
jgi:transcriptional regulator GlxA family with amidase domain